MGRITRKRVSAPACARHNKPGGRQAEEGAPQCLERLWKWEGGSTLESTQKGIRRQTSSCTTVLRPHEKRSAHKKITNEPKIGKKPDKMPTIHRGWLPWTDKRTQLNESIHTRLILRRRGRGAGECEKVAATSTHSAVTFMGTLCSVGRQNKFGVGTCAYKIDYQEPPSYQRNLPRRLVRTRSAGSPPHPPPPALNRLA
ncbi:unnamed protein product [Ectocarpus sp. 12 AP-2014]